MRRSSAILVSIAVAACAPALPPHPVQRALVRDVTRVVDVRTRVGGWLIDESEIIGALPDALRSVCQVRPEVRQSSLAWLDREIEVAGGDVAARWRDRGRDLEEVEDLLRLTRTRLVLRRAGEWADQGRCPFWLEPSDDFAGVNTQGSRFLVTLEGGGRFTPEFALGHVKYGGGGSGRLLVGYGFAEDWSLSLGIEAGGSARFTNLQLGQQSDLPSLAGLGVLPVVLRWHFGLSTFGELEAGPMGYFDEGSADPITGSVVAQFDRGLHFGVALGAIYLRLERGILPKFSFSITVDHVPGRDGKATLTQLGIGLRTGIDISRWRRF
jgi:hypothetical protein